MNDLLGGIRRVGVGIGFTVLLGTLLFVACAPPPLHTLTEDEKVADLHWLFSKFKQNYAPLKMKSESFKLSFAKLKEKYLQDAAATKTNAEFFALVERFAKEFKDAHTGVTVLSGLYPTRFEVEYLGFGGERVDNTLVVTGLLPSISPTGTYPIKIGDVITKIDGVGLAEAARTQLFSRYDLGQEESNLTYLIPGLFFSVRAGKGIPHEKVAKLTVKGRDGSDEREVTLPWVVKNADTFVSEQRTAAAKRKTTTADFNLSESFFETLSSQIQAAKGQKEGEVPAAVAKYFRKGGKFRYWNNFEFVDLRPTWNSRHVSRAVSRLSGAAAPGAIDEFKALRSIPPNAVFLPDAKIFPTFVTSRKIYDKDGKLVKTKQIATMYLNTFSPEVEEPVVLKEVTQTLSQLQNIGVSDIVVDLIDNGGGSLLLGLRMAQLFSTKTLDMSDIQFRASENWINDFEISATDTSSSDAEREIARRVHDDLLRAMDKGELLSRPWSTEVLFPYMFKKHPGLTEKFNIYLLVNEMCASMCDIFSAVMQDNKAATLIGSRTMGAGGNVTMHGLAPNGAFVVSQTESLVLRKDGSYIENNGVTPDVAVDVQKTVRQKYAPVWEKAVDLIVQGD